MLSLGQLYTDNTNDNNNDADDDNDTNDTRWTGHDCIGSLACMPNEPKTRLMTARHHGEQPMQNLDCWNL